MKTYEKPRLNALSLSGNSLLCSCAIDAVEPNMNPDLKQFLEDFNLLGKSNLFVEDMKDCELLVSGYCKNTPDSQHMIFNS